MTFLRVHLREDERQALLKLAQAERRDLAPQAAVIIRRELERTGLLAPTEQSTSATAQPTPQAAQHG